MFPAAERVPARFKAFSETVVKSLGCERVIFAPLALCVVALKVFVPAPVLVHAPVWDMPAPAVTVKLLPLPVTVPTLMEPDAAEG
jgi:hypothetical protein